MNEELKNRIGLDIQENVPLAPYTTFRVGGPAKCFVVAPDTDSIVRAVNACNESDMPCLLLGGGSNVVISDDGFDGLVIKAENTELRFEGDKAIVDAGASMDDLVRATLEAGLTGLEWAAGLPGSVGGAVRGNAGCYGSSIGQSFVEAQVLRDGEAVTLSRKDMEFGYRDSRIKHSDDVILSVTLQLAKGDLEAAKRKARECMGHRKSTLPKEPSAGCIFKNIHIDQLDLDVQKRIPADIVRDGKFGAGWLMDQLDLKGKQIGGAAVSKEHANFIVNTADATADDIVILISLVKQQVRDGFGIQLELEVQLVGF